MYENQHIFMLPFCKCSAVRTIFIRVLVKAESEMGKWASRVCGEKRLCIFYCMFLVEE